jgi:hypothetical protein
MKLYDKLRVVVWVVTNRYTVVVVTLSRWHGRCTSDIRYIEFTSKGPNRMIENLTLAE